jgi:hypothetical protein
LVLDVVLSAFRCQRSHACPRIRLGIRIHRHSPVGHSRGGARI